MRYSGKITLSTQTARSISDKHGNVLHARLPGQWKALCGTEPGRTSDWSAYSETLDYGELMSHRIREVTCQKCHDKLYGLQAGSCDNLRPF